MRHGEAKNIVVNIEEKNARMLLSIEDDGRGFEQKQINTYKGHGLYNMYHMAALLKGKLSIGKGKDRGVRIELVLPGRVE